MAAIQKGTTYQISFGSAALANLTLTSVRVTAGDYNEERIPDENGATETLIYMDPYNQYDIEGVASAAFTAAAKGETVALTIPNGASTNFRCESMTVNYVAGATRVSATLIKESSMTYT